MLYWAAKPLAADVSLFNVFSYLTLRSILATMSALAIALMVGPHMIEKLSRYQIGQVVRTDGPQSHLPKAGTPTMGGLLIIVAVAVTTVLWADLANRFVWIVLGVTLSFGLIGFYDDYLKLVVGNSRGLIARWKYFWQSVVGIAAAFLLFRLAHTAAVTAFHVPFFKTVALPLGAAGFVILRYLMIVWMGKAGDLTDRVDRLAIRTSAIVACGPAVLGLPERH